MNSNNTNTPNGDSKTYNKDDNNGVRTNFFNFEGLNPQVDIVVQVGDCTRVGNGDYKSIDIDARYSDMTIPLIGIGPVLPYSQENIATIKKEMEAYKDSFYKNHKGSVAYSEYKKQGRIRAEQKEASQEDNKEENKEDRE